MDVQRERPGAVSGLARQGLDERGPHSLATCADLDGHGEFWQRATVRVIEEGRVVHVPPGRPEGISRVVSGDECDVCRRRQGPVHRGRPSTGADDPPTRWPGGPSLGGTPRRPVQSDSVLWNQLGGSAFDHLRSCVSATVGVDTAMAAYFLAPNTFPDMVTRTPIRTYSFRRFELTGRTSTLSKR
jgi:hypothetical protein